MCTYKVKQNLAHVACRKQNEHSASTKCAPYIHGSPSLLCCRPVTHSSVFQSPTFQHSVDCQPAPHETDRPALEMEYVERYFHCAWFTIITPYRYATISEGVRATLALQAPTAVPPYQDQVLYIRSPIQHTDIHT